MKLTRSRDSDPLLLATRKLPRVKAFFPIKADLLEVSKGLVFGLRLRDLFDEPQSQIDVVDRIQVREKVVLIASL